MRQQTIRKVLAISIYSLASWLLSPCVAQGQDFPTKPIRIIASQNPGGTTDATARAFAEYLTQKLGVSVTVENRPGAGGTSRWLHLVCWFA